LIRGETTAALPRPRCGHVGRSPREVHVLSSEVLLRGERIVRAAPELEVVEPRRPAERVGLTVVDFESESLATSLATIVPIAALLAIAVEHRAAYGCGDVTIALPRRRGSWPDA